MKTLFFFIVIVASLFLTGKALADVEWAKGERPVVHKFTGDETLWFVAQVYYIKGENYKKLMLSNNIQDPEKVARGTYLMIPQPVHNPHLKNLSERYSRLHEVREVRLAGTYSSTQQKRAIASLTEAKKELQSVVIPARKSQKNAELETDTSTTEVPSKQFFDVESANIRRLKSE